MIAFSKRWFIARLVLSLVLLAATWPTAAPAEASWRSLTGRLPNDVSIGDWLISPDARFVVYVAKEIKVNGNEALVSVPITGSVPITLTPPLVLGGYIRQFAVTPDGQYVIYTATQEAPGRGDLYRVPITGGPAVKLDDSIPSNLVGVADFEIDPDNARVVYIRDDLNHRADFKLYSVPITNGKPVELNRRPEDGNLVASFEIDPVNDRVVYVATQDVQGTRGMFTVPIAGGTAARINTPNLDVDRDFKLHLHGAYPVVFFSATPSGTSSASLYRNPSDGSGVLTPLNYPLASNESVVGYRISPDSSRVVYNVAVTPVNAPTRSYRGNLYGVPIVGGDSTPVSPPADYGFGVYKDRFYFSADSQRVVYERQHNAASSPMLESIAVSGADRKLLYTRGTGEALGLWQVSANGQWVIFGTLPSESAYSIPPTGGTPTPLGSFLLPLITPDSSRLVYTAVQVSGASDLYSQSIAGGEIRNLSRLQPDASAVRPVVSSGGQWIVFGVRYGDDLNIHELRVSDGAEAQTSFSVYLPFIQQ